VGERMMYREERRGEERRGEENLSLVKELRA
jgi:hypothetical protein